MNLLIDTRGNSPSDLAPRADPSRTPVSPLRRHRARKVRRSGRRRRTSRSSTVGPDTARVASGESGTQVSAVALALDGRTVAATTATVTCASPTCGDRWGRFGRPTAIRQAAARDRRERRGRSRSAATAAGSPTAGIGAAGSLLLWDVHRQAIVSTAVFSLPSRSPRRGAQPRRHQASDARERRTDGRRRHRDPHRPAARAIEDGACPPREIHAVLPRRSPARVRRQPRACLVLRHPHVEAAGPSARRPHRCRGHGRSQPRRADSCHDVRRRHDAPVDVDSGRPIGAALPTLAQHDTAAAFVDGGNQLVTLQDNGRGYLWDVQPESWAHRACQVAGRTLTHTEWNDALPGRTYAPACGSALTPSQASEYQPNRRPAPCPVIHAGTRGTGNGLRVPRATPGYGGTHTLARLTLEALIRHPPLAEPLVTSLGR